MFRRLPDYDETTMAIALIERAIAERRVVRVSFFKELRTPAGSPRWFKDSLTGVFGRRVMLAASPVVRTVEPLSWDVNADGDPYMDAICHDAPGEEYPAMRRIRIDRIAVSHRRGLHLVVTSAPFKVAGTGLDPQRQVVTV
jgi:hypothetical protein